LGGLLTGHFSLHKRLPAGAGLGGGSADAAAALRLLAHANRLSLADPRMMAAALATGADVPVCVDSKPRWMRGLGEILSEPVRLPPLHAVLVFPGVPLATKDVFAAFHQNGAHKVAAAPAPLAFPESDREIAPSTLLEWLAPHGNDLESAAVARLPVIAEVLGALRAQSGCAVARMSGSGSACFAIFASQESAAAAERSLSAHTDWWVEATGLGGG